MPSYQNSIHEEIPVGDEKITFKRELGLFNGVSLIVGIMIGSGIFLTPSQVLVYSEGSVGVALIIWTLSGLISLFGALCYAELGLTITESGGDYVYIKRAFGKLPAFLQVWSNMIILQPTGIAIVSLTFASYALKPIYPSCEPPAITTKLLASACICLLAWVNVMRLRWATGVQNIFTVAKLLALIIVIVTGVVELARGRSENFEAPFETEQSYSAENVALAFYNGLFAYTGWNLPRSIYLSLMIVTVVNVLANVAYFSVLSPWEIQNSKAVAVDLANKMFGRFSVVMPIFVSMSCFGGVNGILFTSGRMSFIAAREGQLPTLLEMIHPTRFIPIPSILTTALVSLIILNLGHINTLVNCVSFVQWLSIGMSIAGMLYLRVRKPNLPRPLKFPVFIPIAFLCVCAFLLLLPLIRKPSEVLNALLLVLAGIPVYIVFVAWESKPTPFLKIMNLWTRRLQKIMDIVKED